ncbi:hypothetical protein ISX56_29585, partial [Serratia ureilytica]|nr:hypothetical protein [Serratia ureilytica]
RRGAARAAAVPAAPALSARESAPPPAPPAFEDENWLDEPNDKFPMTSDWQPSPDFQQRAALWNRALDGGDSLYRQAAFDALHAHLAADDISQWGWPAWPERYRRFGIAVHVRIDPTGAQAAVAARSNSAKRQLTSAAKSP